MQTPIGADPAIARRTIDLNHADSDLLQLLPGIGPRRAEAIVEERRTRGAFVSLEDLQRVSGIGPRTIDRIAPFVRVGPPPEIAASPSLQD
ncbi:MAG: helix-hairpin-helix domain-containing protein [Phycisphaeraceae bacterium]|nr:MAG: helix-hairpin-helix domain-containing protein [Phycisphaeraceae bacterium]